MSATIYDIVNLETLTAGIEDCTKSDLAIITAREIAADRGEPVILSDGDGDWLVDPDGSRTSTTVLEDY